MPLVKHRLRDRLTRQVSGRRRLRRRWKAQHHGVENSNLASLMVKRTPREKRRAFISFLNETLMH